MTLCSDVIFELLVYQAFELVPDLKEIGPLSDRGAVDGMNESSVNHLDVEWWSRAVDLVEFIMGKARNIFDRRDYCVVVLLRIAVEDNKNRGLRRLWTTLCLSHADIDIVVVLVCKLVVLYCFDDSIFDGSLDLFGGVAKYRSE
jgi:hypothetical protein